MSHYFTKKPLYQSSSSFSPQKGECFAIAKGKKLGIFFTRQEMLQYTQGVPGRTVKSFGGVDEAKAYLKEQGLVPVKAGGWLTTNQEPILYQPSFALFHKGSNVTPKPGQGKRPHPGGNYASSTTPRQQPSKSIVSLHSGSKEEQSSEEKQRPQPQNKKAKKEPADQEFIELYSDTDDDESDGDVGGGDDNKSGGDDDDDDNDKELPPEPEGDVKFDAIQQQAIDAAFTGSNVFITGVAGTGKSMVTQQIVNDAKGMRKEVAVAAPTGELLYKKCDEFALFTGADT